MIADNEAPEVADEPPPAKPKLTLVVVLSMLLGILLTLMVAGGFAYYRQSQAVHAELLAASDQLKEKSQALDEMKAQIEVLSRQMYLLKEYSIARSRRAGDKSKKSEEVAAEPNAAEGPLAPPVAEAAATPAVVIPPKVRRPKPKPNAQNCELVGKSPEDQAATLQRCVSAMDGGKAKPRSP